jgi:hypothetical protein
LILFKENSVDLRFRRSVAYHSFNNITGLPFESNSINQKDRMKKIVAATILAVLILVSCDPMPIFDKPQPDNVPALTSFPRRLQGKYVDSSQSSVLIISDKLITRDYDYNYVVHKDSLPTYYRLEGDFLVDTANGSREKIVLKGDTVYQHFDWTDTLFNISPDYILKKFKGYHFLNIRYSDSAWAVRKLSLKKGILTIGDISQPDDIMQLREITETAADTTCAMFILTRRQFREFVTHNGFDDQETFTRIRDIKK